MSGQSRRELLAQAAAVGAALALGESCAHATAGPRTLFHRGMIEEARAHGLEHLVRPIAGKEGFISEQEHTIS